MPRDLSILIPARNEMFLKKTIDNILENIEADTEVIAVLDGYWPEEPIPDHERVVIIHYSKSIGQRAATNVAARMSGAKYVMKVDAHCAFDKGFDAKLIKDCDYDTVKQGSRIRKIIKDNPGLTEHAYMGIIMAEFKGKVSGKDVMEIIKRYVK